MRLSKRAKVANRLSIWLLGVWLVLIGLSAFVNLGELRPLLDLLAIAAGVLLLLGL
jgi:hypothetical protein